MSTQSTSIFTRLFRILHLLFWFFRAGYRLFRLREYNQHSKDVMQDLARSMLKVLHIRIEANPNNLPFPPVFLGAANHVSWLDPMILMAMYPTVFIAKREIRSWPVLGAVVARTGAVFINRNSRNDVAPVNEAIVRSMSAGHSVSFFPESKASDGMALLPFKAALFQSALDAPAPVQPLALRYFDGLNRRTARPSFSDANLLVSMWRIVSLREVQIRVDFLPPLAPEGDRFALEARGGAAGGAAVGGFADAADGAGGGV